MESMITIWFGFLISFCSTSVILFFQCSFRKKKKEQQPTSTQTALNAALPHNNQQETSLYSTTPVSGGNGLLFPATKNVNEFAENTQSTQSPRNSPPKKKLGKASIKANNNNKSKQKTSNNKKTNTSKMKKFGEKRDKRQTSMIKTAQLPSKKYEPKPNGGYQLVEDSTQEDELITPSLRAVQKWQVEMRKEFPEISERTQPAETISAKKIELTETYFSDPLVSPSAVSPHENLHPEMTMSLSTHDTTNAKTNNDEATITKSSRYVAATTEELQPSLVSTAKTATTTNSTATAATKADEDECRTAELYTPEWKITRT